MEETQTIPEIAQISFKKRNNKSNFRKRPATPPPALDSDPDLTSSEDEHGRPAKRCRKSAGITAKSQTTARPIEPVQLAASAPSTVGQHANDATKTSDWYDETNNQALSAKELLGSSRGKVQLATDTDGSYKGQANYQSFIQKNPNSVTKQVGPVKASTNVRTITTTDFAPDVCKDYKQTGFCGFGDSCKFLHAREDYKQGWQLDRDWEINTKGKKPVGKAIASAGRSANRNEEDENDEALLESIPFACIICKKSYTNPIITKCGHYFCEACALQRYRKNPNCAACSSGTGGVFNKAKKLTRLLEKKKERQDKKRAAEGEAAVG